MFTESWPGLTWRLRRGFWNRLAVVKYRGNKPATIRKPPSGRPIRRVPIASKYPEIAIRGIFVADHVPSDEDFVIKRRFARLQAALYGIFSPMQPGLPPIVADPVRALDAAYTRAHRRCFPRPGRPRELDSGPDLGALAVASPYACYLHRDGGGTFRWDFASLDKFDRHSGLRAPAAVVQFRVDGTGRLSAARIDTEIGSLRPGERGWEVATRIALCAATTHLSLVRHFNGVHLTCGSAMAIAIRNELAPHHPVTRLMWPHVFGTQCSNEIATIDQMVRGGDFESVFSFTHEGMCELFRETHETFTLASIHPEDDAAERGIAGAPFPMPAFSNRRALYDVMQRHCRRYLQIYYGSDDELAADRTFVSWRTTLDALIPNGVAKVAGSDVTIDGSARLLGTLIYLASVEHEIVGAGLWDYPLWTDVHPTRVSRSGMPQPLDVYRRLVNANFNLNVRRTPLLTDFSSLALDWRGAEAFRRFRAELLALQQEMDRESATSWRMEPKRLKANINA